MQVTLVTPSHRGDYERFAFLRESMAACDIDLPQVAIVPARDVPRFEAVPDRHRLTVVAEGEVLPRGATARLVERLARRDITGWERQQLIKLAAYRVVDDPTWVCVDSDVFFLRPVTAETLALGATRPLLLELRDFPIGPEPTAFRRASARLLGLDPNRLDPALTYTAWLVPLHGSVVRELLDFLDRRQDLPWWRAMTAGSATEYETYGLFARHIHGLAALDAADRRTCWLFYSTAQFPDRLARARDRHGVSAAMVHSRLDCDWSAVQDAVRSLWRRPQPGG
ncbi:MAG TPA: DUF6492 family protein [Mycobacteriales bacterium]|nr:DUF6492 family protein [Mycobacteriales bacterium]